MAAKTCPRCLISLVPARNEHLEVDICIQCGGVFLDHGELSRLARKQPEDLDHLVRLAHPSGTLVTDSSRGTPLCPGCGTQTETYEYAYCSGIKLDRCPQCSGTWADDGELGAIADHIEGGDDEALGDASRCAPFLAQMATEAEISEERWTAIGGLCTALRTRLLTGQPRGG